MKNKMALAGAFAAPLMFALLISTASAATLTRQLQVGMTGADVSDLQTFLALDSSIYPEGLVTGYFGALTQAAVQRFQAKNGIVSSGTAASTGYGRVGPTTMATINSQMGGGGTVSDTTEGAGKVTNVGSVQPVLSAVAVSVTNNSATLAWNSSVPATARVMYSTSWPFNYRTASSVTGTTGVSNSQSVTLTGLQGGTTYYYTVESTDPSGNFSWSQGGASFRTQ